MEEHIEKEIRVIRALRAWVEKQTRSAPRLIAPRYPVCFLKLADIQSYTESVEKAEELDPDHVECDCRFCQTQPLITPH